MGLVLVSYDLHEASGDQYAGLAAELKQTSWWHHLESTWILGTNETPNQVYERLAQHVLPEDRLIIVRIDGAARQGWLPHAAWEWLKQREQT